MSIMLSSYIDNIYKTLDKFLICKFFKNLKIIILSIQVLFSL